MKKISISLLVIILTTLQILAQAPQSFKYQAVVRDGAGTVLANQMVGFQLSILEASETGTVIYTETFTTTTNAYGLVNLIVGEGTPVTGDFSTIDWGSNSHFLKVELDETGGTTYAHIGTSKLNSVPYALNAKTAENVFSGNYNDLSNAPDLSNYDSDVTDDFSGDYDSLYNKPILTGDVTGDIEANTVEKIQGLDVSINTPASGQVLKWNGTEWAPADDNTTGGSGVDGVVDGASFSGTTTKTLTLSRSNGLTPLSANFTDEVDDADADPFNEIQILSISNDTIYLTNGGFVKLPAGFDGDYNSLTNQPAIPANTSDLTNDSGFITSADDADADPTNELITGATLNGTNLQITDAGGTNTVDLSSLDNAGTDSQTLSVSGTSLTISNGNTVILQDNVDDADADATNELQTINKIGSTVTLSNGGGSFTDEVDDADHDIYNELQVLNFSNDTLYLSDGGQVYMGAYGNLWEAHGDDIYNTNTKNVGVGLENPEGKLVVQGDTAASDTIPLFEVKNKDGITVFAVYDGGVRMYVNDDPAKANNDKSGFAIGGYRLDKSITNEYMRVTPDSVRIYIKEENTNKANNDKGGFAIGGYRLDKTTPEDYLNIYAADTVYVIDTTAQMLWYPLKEAFLSGKVLVEHADSVGLNSWATGYVSKSIGNYSQAMGYQARAFGDNSTAIGNYANAITDNSFAFGDSAIAKGVGAFAIGSIGRDDSGNPTGQSTLADGEYAMAIGMGAHSSGRSALSAGSNCLSSGDYSISFGFNTTASGDYSSAFGRNAVAAGNYSFAAGFNSQSNNYSSYSFGRNAHAAGNYSYAIGDGSYTTSSFSYAIGAGALAEGIHSFAIGSNADARNRSAFAIGSNTFVDGDYATAIGKKAQAHSSCAIAIGYESDATGDYSLAMGDSAYTTANYASAIGYHSIASGLYSNAMGREANSSGESAFAFGYTASASGANSFALGKNTVSSGSGSYALGYSSTASGDYSTAIGRDAEAVSSQTIAIGRNTHAQGSNSVAIGYNANANHGFGDAIAIGRNTNATGWVSLALGLGSDATGANSLAINGGTASGLYSKSIGYITTSGDYSFGICLDDDNSHEVSQDNTMSIMGGIVGIGLTNPVNYSKLEVLTDDANGYASYFVNDGNDVNRWGIKIRAGADNHAGNNYMIRCYDGDNSFEGALIIDDGVLEIVQNSDATLKKNIFNTKVSANDMLNKIRIVDYSYKQGANAIETGFIAQELLQVFPEMVIKDPETNKYGIKPLKLIPILTKANQEQQKMIDDLLIRIEKLEKMLEEK